MKLAIADTLSLLSIRSDTMADAATLPNRSQPFARGARDEQRSSDAEYINVGPHERNVSLLTGAALVYFGLTRRSTIGLAFAGAGMGLLYRGVTGHCPISAKLGRDTASEPAPPEEYFEHAVQACHVITINKSADDLYRFWRNFSNLPKFMESLERVEVLDEKRSRWIVKGPAAVPVQWDAEIINDEPGKLIAWWSLGHSDVDNAGSVRFLPGGENATEVHVAIDYIPPGGQIGAAVAKLFGDDAQSQLETNLGKLKELMERGNG
jgi:uncharacterized membrane protein